MRDIKSVRLLYAKGVLFLVLGLLAGGLLVAERPTLKTVGLLAVAVWAFARAYYFAFYVLGRYVDPAFRFSGLMSLARYLLARELRPTPERSGPARPAGGEARGL